MPSADAVVLRIDEAKPAEAVAEASVAEPPASRRSAERKTGTKKVAFTSWLAPHAAHSAASYLLAHAGSTVPSGATARPLLFEKARIWSVLRPVSIVVRDGTHCGDAAYVRTKLTPAFARLSKVGVAKRLLTGDVGSTTRPSIESHMRKRMLGFGALKPAISDDSRRWWCGSAAAAAHANASHARM